MLTLLILFAVNFCSIVNAANEEDLLSFIKQPFNVNNKIVYMKNDYIVRTERLLNSRTYSAEEYDQILSRMNEVLEIMNEEQTTDPTAMSWQAEHRVLRLIYESAEVAGITVKYGKTDSSNGYLAFYEKDGTKIDEIYYAENGFKVTGVGLWAILLVGLMLTFVGFGLRIYREKLFA